MQEFVPVRPVEHEIDPGQVPFGAHDGRGIHPLPRPQPHETIAGEIAAQRGDVADTRALTGGRDGRVGGVAAVSFQV